MPRYLFTSLSFAAVVYACQREWYLPLGHTHKHQSTLHKRQEAAFPPVLTEQETLLVNSFDNNTIDDWSYYYTHENKLAGLGKAAAQWTADRWAEFGFESHLAEYHVYLSHPVSASLEIDYGNGTKSDISLVEPVLPEDDVTGRPDEQPTFHGYSASGDVEAEYVYVGSVFYPFHPSGEIDPKCDAKNKLTKNRRGQVVDFERLKALGVQLEGKIALAKYGGPFRGLKVKNAQDNGMIGVVIFTDTDGDGNVTVAKGVAAYPSK